MPVKLMAELRFARGTVPNSLPNTLPNNLPNKPFTFLLDWVAGAQFAGLHWALEKGLYAAAGLDVTLVPWHDEGGETVAGKLLALGSAGVLGAACSEDNLTVPHAIGDHVMANNKMMAFGAMLQDTPMVLMSPAARPIRSLQELRGKRVGMHPDGIRVLEVVLALEGMSTDEVDIHEVGYDLGHLQHGGMDAQQGYLTTEPLQLAALGFEVETLAVKHAEMLPYAQVYFAQHTQLERDPHAFQAFLTASSAGWKEVCANPDAAADLLGRVLGDSSQVAQQRRMLERMIPLVTGELSVDEIGTINNKQWAKNFATYVAHGLVDRPVALHDVVFTFP
jgi:NitT/TauT family transport system substrate-binding protein